MFSKIVFAAALLVPFASQVAAECGNACSGHGRCTNYKQMFSTATATVPIIQMPTYSYSDGDFGYSKTEAKKDSCTCFTRSEGALEVYGYTGADCSKRTCPYAQSWDSAPHAADAHTLQTECANRGRCDRKTGGCKCFPGYTGKACQRTTCPNNCSGRGSCLSLKEIAEKRAAETGYAALTGFTYASIQYGTAWDAERILGCDCDAGYRGADCSRIECPSGTDPLGGPGSESGRACSGRGSCDFSAGVCKCFRGFFGSSCEKQRANVV
jgi:hypothetical protein